MPDNLETYYKYLKTKGADVPPDVNTFRNALQDENNSLKYYNYVKGKGYDAPDDYNNFVDALGLKKKGISGTGADISQGVSQGFDHSGQGVHSTSPNKPITPIEAVDKVITDNILGKNPPQNLQGEELLKYGQKNDKAEYGKDFRLMDEKDLNKLDNKQKASFYDDAHKEIANNIINNWKIDNKMQPEVPDKDTPAPENNKPPEWQAGEKHVKTDKEILTDMGVYPDKMQVKNEKIVDGQVVRQDHPFNYENVFGVMAKTALKMNPLVDLGIDALSSIANIKDKTGKPSEMQWMFKSGIGQSSIADLVLYLQELKEAKTSNDLGDEQAHPFQQAYKNFQDNQKQKELYLNQYDPTMIDNLGASLIGFTADAPLFAAGGDVGKGILQGAKYATEKLMQYGIKREAANEIIKSSTAKILTNFVKSSVQSAGSLGGYSFVQDLTKQIQEGKNLEDISMKEAIKEGGKSTLLGAGVGLLGEAFGLGERQLNHQMLNSPTYLRNLARYGVKTADLAATTGMFVYGGNELSDQPKDLTVKDYLQNALFLGVLKATGGGFGKDAITRYDKLFKENEPLFTPEERKTFIAEKENDKEIVKDITSNKENFQKFINNDNIPYSAKAKVMMLVAPENYNSFYPDFDKLTKRTEIQDNADGSASLNLYDNNHKFLYTQRYKNHDIANEKAQDVLQANIDTGTIDNVNNLQPEQLLRVNNELVKKGYEGGLKNPIFKQSLSLKRTERNAENLKAIESLNNIVLDAKNGVEEPEKTYTYNGKKVSREELLQNVSNNVETGVKDYKLQINNDEPTKELINNIINKGGKDASTVRSNEKEVQTGGDDGQERKDESSQDLQLKEKEEKVNDETDEQTRKVTEPNTGGKTDEVKSPVNSDVISHNGKDYYKNEEGKWSYKKADGTEAKAPVKILGDLDDELEKKLAEKEKEPEPKESTIDKPIGENKEVKEESILDKDLKGDKKLPAMNIIDKAWHSLNEMSKKVKDYYLKYIDPVHDEMAKIRKAITGHDKIIELKKKELKKWENSVFNANHTQIGNIKQKISQIKTEIANREEAIRTQKETLESLQQKLIKLANEFKSENIDEIKSYGGDLNIGEEGTFRLDHDFDRLDFIKSAIKNDKYQKWISEGRMTANDAKTIIESAGLEVPKDILDKAKGKEPIENKEKPIVEDTDKKTKELQSAIDKATNDLKKLKKNNPNEFKKYGTPKLKSKIEGSYKALTDFIDSRSEDLNKLKDENFKDQKNKELADKSQQQKVPDKDLPPDTGKGTGQGREKDGKESTQPETNKNETKENVKLSKKELAEKAKAEFGDIIATIFNTEKKLIPDEEDLWDKVKKFANTYAELGIEQLKDIIKTEIKPILDKLGLTDKEVDAKLDDIIGNEIDISAKKAELEAKMERELGTDALDRMNKTINEKKTTDVKDIYEDMSKKVNKGEIDPKELRKKILNKNPISLTASEQEAVMLRELARLDTLNTTIGNEIDKLPDGKLKDEKIKDKIQAEFDIEQTSTAIRLCTREFANIGNLTQAYLGKRGELYWIESEMKRRWQDLSKNKTDLTDEEQKFIHDISTDIKESGLSLKDYFAQKDEILKRLKKAEEENKILKELKAKSDQQNRIDRKLNTESKITNSKQRYEKAKNRFFQMAMGKASMNVDPMLAVELGKMATEKIYQGVVKFDDLVHDLYEDIKEKLPEWTKQDIIDHLAKRGVQTKKMSDESKLSGIMKRTAKYESKTEHEDFEPVKKELKDINKKIDEARLRQQSAKWKFEDARYKKLMKERTLPEKFFATWINLRTGFGILSGFNIWGKLIAYTANELLIKEPTDMITTVLSQVFRKTAKGSLSQGQFSLKSHALFYKTYVKSTWGILKKGFRNVDTEHLEKLWSPQDTHRPPPDEFIKGFGFAHGVEKLPLKDAEFAKKQFLIRKSILRNNPGIDIESEQNRLLIGAAALEEANTRILMNKNKASKGFRNAQNWMYRQGGGWKAAYYVSKVLFPIINVPMNIAEKTMHSAVGLVEFGVNACRGFDNLTPEQKDKVLMHFKEGLPGAALGIIALSTANTYIDQKTHRFYFMGHEIPKIFEHIPLILSTKLYTQAKMEFLKKNPDESVPEKILRSGLSMGIDFKSAVPFLNNDIIFGKDIKRTEANIEDLFLSFVVPQGSADIAKFIDERTGKVDFDKYFEGSDVYYKPKNIAQRFKSKIPGWSKTVPINYASIKADEQTKINGIAKTNYKLAIKEKNKYNSETLKQLEDAGVDVKNMSQTEANKHFINEIIVKDKPIKTPKKFNYKSLSKTKIVHKQEVKK